jgi:hypothetical protein
VSFETPAAWWGLSTLLLLAVFSLWRQAASRVVVPSVLLWKRIPERNPPVRELRRPQWRVELLLQAAAVGLLVGALAGPFVETERALPRRIAFVVDTSPRMGAGGRLEALVREARALAEGALKEDEVTWYAAAPAPGRVEDPAVLRPGTRRADLAPLVTAARAVSDVVVVLGDRPVEGARTWSLSGPSANAGIAAFRADDETLFARFVNHGPERRTSLRIETGAGTRTEPVTLPPGSSIWTRKGDFARESRIALTLDLDDGWAADDTAEAVRRPPSGLEVSLRGRHHPSLLRVLESLPNARVVREALGTALSVGLDEEPAPGGCRVRLYGAQGRLPGTPKIHAHELTRGLEGREDELAAAGLGELPAGARDGEFLLSAGGRAAATVRGDEIRLAVDIDLWGRSAPSFPIFWANVAERARGGTSAFQASGILDESESDVAGSASDPSGELGDPRGRERRKRPLGGWAALAALFCVAAAWSLQSRAG